MFLRDSDDDKNNQDQRSKRELLQFKNITGNSIYTVDILKLTFSIFLDLPA